jgi:hypothetical protein
VVQALVLELAVNRAVEVSAELHCLVELMDDCSSLWLVGIDPCLKQMKR